MPAKTSNPQDQSADTPHYHGHRERLRERFHGAGPDALSDYELLEMALFPALPAARHQAAGQSAAEEIRLVRRSHSCARSAPARSRRRRRCLDQPDQAARRRSSPGRQRRDQAQHRAVVLERRDRLLPGRHGVRRQGAVSPAVSRQAQPADRRRGAADRHRRPHAGLSARGDQARAGTIGDRADPGAQPPLRRSDALAGRHPDDARRSSTSPPRSAFPCTTTSSSARTGMRA